MYPNQNQHTPPQFDAPTSNIPTTSKRRHARIVLVVLAAVVLLGLIAAGLVVAATANTKQKVNETTQKTPASDTPAMPESVELVAYSSNEGGFSMLVPADMKMEGEADQELKGGYNVLGLSGTKGVGNRIVSVNKFVYPEVFGAEFDEWLAERIEFVESNLRANEEEWPEGIEGKILHQSTTYVSDYTSYGMRTETVTQPRSSTGTLNTQFNDYLFVFISPTVFYQLTIEGNDKDTDFRKASTKMLQSLEIRES